MVVDQFTPHLDAGEHIFAVDVDPLSSGLPLKDLDLDKIVGMWYLGPYDSTVSPSWKFKVEGLDLPVGTTVNILNSSYSDRKWLDAGTATVGEDGVLHTDVNSGISILSTLVLVEQ